MSLISIEVTPEQHRWLQSEAEACGKTVEQFVRDRALEEDALEEDQELIEFLQGRIEEAKQGKISTRSAEEIFDEVLSHHHS